MVRAPSVRAKPARSSRPSGRPARNVILVDDDTLERVALTRLLRVAGYTVTAFERPSDVLLSVLPTANTCLVLDIYMPEMNGMTLWRELHKRGYQVPTVLITGHRDRQSTIDGREVGIATVLYKPIEEKELIEAIERVLAHPPP